jgi:ComF family protein
MKKMFKKIINFILPPRCLNCGKVINNDDALCVECLKKINFITAPYCKKCGKPLEHNISNDLVCGECLNTTKRSCFRISRSAVIYDEFSKKIILDFKFASHIENKKLLANWMFLAGTDIWKKDCDVIIPVPMHFTRFFKRRYNQSAIIAKELSKLCKIDVMYDVLKKGKYTKPQIECTSKQRIKNLKDAFYIENSEKIKGKRIVLIDDVYTTGSTLKECAKTLLKAGAKSVDTLTIAKVHK